MRVSVMRGRQRGRRERRVRMRMMTVVNLMIVRAGHQKRIVVRAGKE